ncbi:NUDIX hydrolase [Parvularcula sp. LCG005]|uniref:NUDIX hydrolase n=1 Tax=Parvularcula sp. LCG005 TaxID=3078805 RepID=UPI00294326C4|nr:NUDIX hydrolase [Parvularcula sp. LCG005]WOI52649.1 NUDIX hydrolase [Parvularcula sp. LCG005]
MTEKIGPWTINARRIGYDNPWLTVEHHDVTDADGRSGIYGVARFKNVAVGVLPLFDDGTVPLVGQHRFPFDAYSWELPEGGAPKTEEPVAAAHRELAEETGVRAGQIVEFGRSHLSNSVTDEAAIYFLAWDLTEGEADPDPDEVLSQRRISFGQLAREVMDGSIDDALTILMVQTAIIKAQMGALPDRPRDLILSEMASILRPAVRGE